MTHRQCLGVVFACKPCVAKVALPLAMRAAYPNMERETLL